MVLTKIIINKLKTTIVKALLLMAIIVPVVIHFQPELKRLPGPPKNVTNYNERLTSIAKTAMPIINKIIEFHISSGKYPSIEEVRELVHDPRLNSNSNSDFGNSIVYPNLHSPGMGQSWRYAPISIINDHIVGFFLCNDFSLSELLTYKYMNGKGEWIYQFNDINETVIKLNP